MRHLDIHTLENLHLSREMFKVIPAHNLLGVNVPPRLKQHWNV